MYERVAGFIDGFNLYHGLKDRAWQRFQWLDPALLLENLLKYNQKCARVSYFTARLSGPGASWERQKIFLEAVEYLGKCSLFYGHYQSSLRRCAGCGISTNTPSEKMTDVNIATELLAGAFLDLYDSAILITGDADLTPAVLKVREIFPHKRIVIACPPHRFSQRLCKAATAHFNISRKAFAASQLPERIEKSESVILERPKEWA